MSVYDLIPMPHVIRELIKKVSQVTLDDLKRVGDKYFRPLFDPKHSKCAVCCHPTKVDENVKEFKE